MAGPSSVSEFRAPRLALSIVAGTLSPAAAKHPDKHRPQRPILLAVDQELGERCSVLSPSSQDIIAAVSG